MFGKMVVQASKGYRKEQVLLDSEKRAPRRIILLVIFFQAIEFGLLIYLILLRRGWIG